jgi:RNA polymerase sigma factor (sigma-70 family)
MSFPETRLTFVERLASAGSEADWRALMQDYWGPICRFALRWGAASLDDAEDVAAETFQVLWENRLFARWVASRSARFRSLLCGVVRKILANRHRVQANRQRLAGEIVDYLQQCGEADEPSDAFYVAWVEALVQRAVESLAADYCRHAKGDYLRVLYGRLCQGLTLAAVAQSLEITPAMADHYFREAKTRLADALSEEVRRRVQRYSLPAEIDQDYTAEWAQLGQYLTAHGGLDEAVRQAYELLDPVTAQRRESTAVSKTLTRLTAIRPRPGQATEGP